MKQLTQEQLEAIYNLVSQYNEDFNYEVEYWDDGNCDDGYKYGVETGEQYILGELKAILERN